MSLIEMNEQDLPNGCKRKKARRYVDRWEGKVGIVILIFCAGALIGAGIQSYLLRDLQVIYIVPKGVKR